MKGCATEGILRFERATEGGEEGWLCDGRLLERGYCAMEDNEGGDSTNGESQ